MRALHIASEIFPLAKTGGLADVTGALLPALSALDVDARLLLPGYPQAVERSSNPHEAARLDGLLGCGKVRLLAARTPDTGIPVWLVDCPQLYRRAGGLYQDQAGAEWSDNALRFALLSHVAAAIAAASAGLSWRPDIVHAHDWHAGLVPLLLSQPCGAQPAPATVFTIHNLAYQGLYPAEQWPALGLPSDPAVYSALEFYGRLSFLKAGIAAAHALTTVSPTYAKEILTPEYGCGLDGLLRQRANRLTGILNGADYRIWDPVNDPHLTHRFSNRHIAPKRVCKVAIQQEMGLEADIDRPLLAFSSRIDHQKMPDIVLEALPALLADGAQFALVAEGEPSYEACFRDFAASHPGQAAVHVGYEEPLAHRLLAGADILLHPSRFEPCGLAPIYAMRYGTLPVVRRTGGAIDSVTDVNEQTVQRGEATGFSFEEATAEALVACTRRALALYREPIAWRKVQLHAMQQDFGWARPARAHLDLYRGLAAEPAGTDDGADREELKLIA
jgi:starch synthase